MALVAAACLIPILPNIIYLIGNRQPLFFGPLCVLGALIALLPLLLGAPVWLSLAILLPFAIATPMATGYAWTTGYPPSILALQILREGTREEFSTYFAQLAMLAAAGLLIGILFLWLIWNYGRRRLQLAPPLRWAAVLGLLLLLGKDVLRNGWRSGSQIAFSRLEKTYPVSPLAIGLHLRTSGGVIPDRRSVLDHYIVHQNFPSSRRQICVLVVGESVRAEAFGLYHPGLETTPLLRQQSDLTVFRDAKSCGTATIQAVPIMMTGSFPQHGEILPFRELGMVEAFRLAGFDTFWLTTQQGDGEISSFITAFSVNAQHLEFLNGRLERSVVKYEAENIDGDLLPSFRRALANPAQKIFIVLHTTGSHGPYVKRYPPAFERWPVSAGGKQQMFLNRWLPPYTAEQVKQLDHAYFNSVLYTDWFLNQVIETLRSVDAATAMIYASDHGENRADNPSMPATHGVLSRETTTIPMLIWTSPTLQSVRPDLESTLRAHAGLPVSAQDLFSTVCGLYGVQSVAYDPTRDLSGEGYRTHPRQVMLLDDSIVPPP